MRFETFTGAAALALAAASPAQAAVIFQGTLTDGQGEPRQTTFEASIFPQLNVPYRLYFSQPVTAQVTLTAQTYLYPVGEPSDANNFQNTFATTLSGARSLVFFFLQTEPGFSGYTDRGTFRISAPDLAGDVAFKFGIGSVPEPSTWTMMILGFGAAAAAMRRQRAMPQPA